MKSAPKKRYTIDDVAREAGVSISTVSRVMNKTAPVADETAQRIWQAIERLEYAPNAAAKTLAQNRTDTIGLLVPEISGPFFPLMLRGVETCVRENNYDLLIYSVRVMYRPAAGKLPPLGEHNAAGLLIFTGCMSEAEIIRLYQRGFPMALLHCTPPQGLAIPSITFENKDGTEKIVSHLIDAHHCRRILYLKGPDDNEDAAWRLLGYQAALEKHALAFDPALVQAGEFDDRVAYETVTKAVASGAQFDAICAGDDESAAGAMLALADLKQRVPEDVAVVGFDDDYLARYLPVALTTVHAPIEDAGYEAARQLIKLIRSGEAAPFTLLPTDLVIRRSCGCP